MNQPVSVKTVTAYSPEVAAGIGLLLPDLSPSPSPDPVSRERLEAQIHSPWHDQLIAEQAGRIVGAAAVSFVLGTIQDNTKVQLEDFVVSSDETVRGTGVGLALWNSVVDWTRRMHAQKIVFTSHPSREAARKFYLRQGAVVRDTATFEYVIPKRQQ